MARPKTLSADDKKSARVSLLLTKKLFADIATLAQIKKITVNELFNFLAAQVVKKNRSAIDKVQAVIDNVSSDVDLIVSEGGDADENP